MKSVRTLILVTLAVGACSDAPEDESTITARVTFPPRETGGASSGDGLVGGLDWTAPVHTRLEVYIINHALGPTTGATLRPDLSLLRPESRSKYSVSAGMEDQTRHTAEFQFIGPGKGGDQYSVTVSQRTGAGLASFSKSILYVGEDLEVWRNAEWVIGFRPAPQEPSPQASPEGGDSGNGDSPK